MGKPQTRKRSYKRNMAKRATQFKKKVVPKEVLVSNGSRIPGLSTATIHDTQRFKDKVAIVTGGCAGIGRGIADLLVEQGGKVAVLDIDDATGNAIKNENYLFVHCDVSKDDDVKKAIETAVNAFGKLDLLVNNAAIQPSAKTIDEMEVAEFERVVNTNLVGYFRMCKYSLPHLRKTKGSIVNLASITSTIGLKGVSDYVATKGGIVSMTRALAVDEAAISEVRINSISPGSVNTPLLHTFYDESVLDGLSKTNLMGRFAETREIALACLYLAVDATYCTGSNLKCTGGIEFGLGTKLL